MFMKLLRSIKKILIIIKFKCFSALFLLIPVKNNYIFFTSYYGSGYGDNAKYIVEEILSRNLNMKIIWEVKNKFKIKENFPEGIKLVKHLSVKSIFYMTLSKIWVDNSRKIVFPIKRTNQYYIQTWHAGLGLKKIEKDAELELSKTYVKMAKNDSKKIDFLISNSDYRTKIFENSFWYNGPIINIGHPRNDAFFKDEDEQTKIKNRVFNYFSIKEETRVILYAPTFRNNSIVNEDSFNLDDLVETLNSKTNKKWVLLLKFHPNEKQDLIKSDKNNYVINASKYSDMQELVIACDILISDYSSVLFDSALMYKPTFIYAFDLKRYNNERGTYINLNNLPFKIAESKKELIEIVSNHNQNDFKLKVDNYFFNQGLNEKGHSASNMVNLIEKLVNKGSL